MSMHLNLTTPRLAVVVLLALVPSAVAQSNRRPSSALEHGYEIGYRDGYDFGRNSQASNREQDIINQKLRAADREYVPSYGPQEEYRQGYTDGFRSGLDDARNERPSRAGRLFPNSRDDAAQNARRDDRASGIPPNRPVYVPPIRPEVIARADTARGRGYEHGYREGYDFGRTSQFSSREQDIVNQRLRSADRDYVESFGPRDMYRQGYEDGFRMGLDDARYNVRYRLPELLSSSGNSTDGARGDRAYGDSAWRTASDIGYQDGMSDANQDARDGRFSPASRHTAWRNALHGYRSTMGTQATYQRAYRIAYEAGYAEGSQR
ncbi:MAG: hypothetical protein ABI823_17645 [Bryobacteraceae bacterium]